MRLEVLLELKIRLTFIHFIIYILLYISKSYRAVLRFINTTEVSLTVNIQLRRGKNLPLSLTLFNMITARWNITKAKTLVLKINSI